MRKKELREYYFALRDHLYKEGETGLSRTEIHHLAKIHIFPYLVDEPENWDLREWDEKELLSSVSPSINWLSEKGLESYVESFKVFSLNNYNVAL